MEQGACGIRTDGRMEGQTNVLCPGTGVFCGAGPSVSGLIRAQAGAPRSKSMPVLASDDQRSLQARELPCPSVSGVEKRGSIESRPANELAADTAREGETGEIRERRERSCKHVGREKGNL